MTILCLETSGPDYPLTQRDITYEGDPKNEQVRAWNKRISLSLAWLNGKATAVKGRLS
jgi:hypothetical protein